MPPKNVRYAFYVDGEHRYATDQQTERRWGHGPLVNILYDATQPSGGKASAKPQLQRRCSLVGLAIKAMDVKKTQKDRWSRETSLFGDFVADTPDLLVEAFEADWKMTRVPLFVKNREDLHIVRLLLLDHYKFVISLFKTYSSTSETSGTASGSFAMSWSDFTKCMISWDIPDQTKCRLVDLDRIFIACKSPSGTPMDKDIPTDPAINPPRALTRHQWLEAIVRVAKFKYFDTKVSVSIAESLAIMMRNNMIHNDGEIEDCNQFRRRFLYFREVDEFFAFHMDVLRTVHANMVACSKSRDGNNRYISVDGALELLLAVGAIDSTHFTKSMASVTFVQSKETEIDEMLPSSMHQKMRFCEFLEFVARCAHKRYCPSKRSPAPKSEHAGSDYSYTAGLFES